METRNTNKQGDKMKLYDFKFIQTLNNKSLRITIDLHEFNNVEIYIDCTDLINDFMKLINSKFYNTKFIQDKMTKFLEEIYHNETDPHSRGEN